jgi:hypothetical protein
MITYNRGDIMNIQVEMLKLISDYNNTDRKVIKENLKRIMWEKSIKPADIIALGFGKNNVYQWSNSKANNIPMFEQALLIAVKHDFDITELIK